MFDKMIISDRNGAESKGRARYFLVTSSIVALLFATTVVLSIYAVNLDLGTDDFELSMMLAPVTPDEPEPRQPEPEREQSTPQRSEVPTRAQNILRLEEQPIAIPDNVSVTRNKFQPRPLGRFEIDPTVGDRPGSGLPSDGTVRGGGGSASSGMQSESGPVADTLKLPDPPPVIKPKPPTMISKGVINGRATHLPPPPYPAPAKMVGAQGAVSVQVTIDENGKVISAKAVDGHPLLKAAAEKAAWSAKFSPTKLSDVPVKVTGVIVYNFKKS